MRFSFMSPSFLRLLPSEPLAKKCSVEVKIAIAIKRRDKKEGIYHRTKNDSNRSLMVPVETNHKQVF